jgi:hypothetical protein
MRTIEASLTWPDGTAAQATLKAISPDLGARLEWTGDKARIAALPAEIAPGAGGERCHLDNLLTFAEAHAMASGGRFAWDASGHYEIGAE